MAAYDSNPGLMTLDLNQYSVLQAKVNTLIKRADMGTRVQLMPISLLVPGRPQSFYKGNI